MAAKVNTILLKMQIEFYSSLEISLRTLQDTWYNYCQAQFQLVRILTLLEQFINPSIVLEIHEVY